MKLHLNALAASVLLASASLAPAFAADEASAKPNDDSAKAEQLTAGAEAGMRAYVDPETGTLTSKPVDALSGDAKQAPAEFTENDAAIVDSTATDGSPMRVLNGQYEQAFTVKVDAEGRRSVICTDAGHADRAAHSHDVPDAGQE